jgi:hypothetical protein
LVSKAIIFIIIAASFFVNEGGRRLPPNGPGGTHPSIGKCGPKGVDEERRKII